MEDSNQTQVDEFIFEGLTNNPRMRVILFVIIFTSYILNIFGNGITTVLVITDVQLHMPMYYLLSNLSFLDIWYSTVIFPKTLSDLMAERKSISFRGCMTQLYFFHFCGCTEACLLAAMAYDRYLAICLPLRYAAITNGHFCLLLSSCCWLIGSLYSLIHTIFTAKLPFCASNLIRHFLCDIKPLLLLACTNTDLNRNLVTMVTGSVVIIAFLLILVSYSNVAFHVIKIKSSQGRQKALSTCSSHLTIVGIFFGSGVYMYLLQSKAQSGNQDVLVVLFIMLVAPTLNPIIYTLRNKKVQGSLRKAIQCNNRLCTAL